MDLVAEGEHVVVLARPRELVRAPASRRVIEAIAPDERLETTRQHTGIDVRELEELLWAETDEGTILVLRGPFSAPLAVAEIGHRMLPLESTADEPFIRRGGHYRGERRDLVAISDSVLVAITGAPALTEAVLARVRSGGRAATRSDLASLVERHASAPLLIAAPHPVALPPGSGIALLLARQRSLVATARPSGATAIDLALDLQGEFPPGAEANFRALAEALAESDLGGAVGMRDALASLSIRSGDEQVVLRATVPSAAIATGLRILFDAEISELLDLPADEVATSGVGEASAAP